KELGVENKVVLAMVNELGIAGKASHSSSLEADEADQVRRAVIRKAIGSSPDSEVVTKRVDKLSGATGTFLERRKGNVIGRRRHGEGEGEGEQAPAESEAAAPHSESNGSLALKHQTEIEEETPTAEVAPAPEDRRQEKVEEESEEELPRAAKSSRE